MRHMSFALTTPQILARTKTVTRRVGWRSLQSGDLIQAIEKGQGLKKGAKVRKLAVLRIVDVRLEAIGEVTAREVILEGFPEMSRAQFIGMFMATHGLSFMSQNVTRIEFEYVDTLTDADMIRLIQQHHHRTNIGPHEDDPSARIQWEKAWVDPGGSIFAGCPYLHVPVFQPGWSEPGWDPVRRVYPNARAQRLIAAIGWTPTKKAQPDLPEAES